MEQELQVNVPHVNELNCRASPPLSRAAHRVPSRPENSGWLYLKFSRTMYNTRAEYSIHRARFQDPEVLEPRSSRPGLSRSSRGP